jgi:hypothetical protein
MMEEPGEAVAVVPSDMPAQLIALLHLIDPG